MCSAPVMFGGGGQIVYLGFLLCASATNRPSDSQRASQPASMARGSNAFGISLGWSGCLSFMFKGSCFIACREVEAPARRLLYLDCTRGGTATAPRAFILMAML